VEFDLNDEQREIQTTARDFLASRFKPVKVRELAESGSPYDDDLWRQMCELGWSGIAISEEYGGQGLGTVELAILQEQLGYALAPSPLISNAYAGALIESAGSDEQRSRWLPGIASGEQRGAAEFTCDPEPVVGAAGGAAVIVLADGEGAKLVEQVEVTLERLDLIDDTRAYFRARAEGGEPLPGDVAHAGSVGQVALAAELVGHAQRALDMAVEYAKEREQFDRPIGAYQAVSHRLADMLW
jgi:alkylation response protein AidB-like acyl-CoA dehydrogenase